MIKQILLVGLGGGIGSIFRYLTSLLVNRHVESHFPWATFAVNLLGCFLIGLLAGLAARGTWLDENLRLLFITGFCGGYTTFSAFSMENMVLIGGGHYVALIVYILSSVLVGLLAVWLGMLLLKP